ncbi:hypothetical protein TNCV_843141 [Trichonephila clavipes]|nr:hypothetical protein TNCV_843141 [Trichonephila clavipes]
MFVSFVPVVSMGITVKNQKLISYPDNIPSVIRLVPHGHNIPVPLPSTELQKISRWRGHRGKKKDGEKEEERNKREKVNNMAEERSKMAKGWIDSDFANLDESNAK